MKTKQLTTILAFLISNFVAAQSDRIVFAPSGGIEDVTRLRQDSIIQYTVNGVISGSDTIRVLPAYLGKVEETITPITIAIATNQLVLSKTPDETRPIKIFRNGILCATCLRFGNTITASPPFEVGEVIEPFFVPIN